MHIVSYTLDAHGSLMKPWARMKAMHGSACAPVKSVKSCIAVAESRTYKIRSVRITSYNAFREEFSSGRIRNSRSPEQTETERQANTDNEHTHNEHIHRTHTTPVLC